MDILYEDKHVTVCVKTPGLLSEESGNVPSVPKLLKEHYLQMGEKYDVFTVHRLDRNVGGIMVFARTHLAASKLAAQINDRSFLKEYLAVLRGLPPQENAALVDLLFRDSVNNKTYVVSRPRKGVREASLEYSLLFTAQYQNNTLSLVKIKLHTGRTHQIRVQFASRKLPLVGDGRYGSRDGKDTPALWAFRLGFVHPASGKYLAFTAPPPKIYPFDLFPDHCMK